MRAAELPSPARMFRPHVTLARDCLRSTHRGRVAAIQWQVKELALVASTQTARGSHYRNVGEWALAAG